MNESTMRIDNSGLYAARWLVLLERLGLSRTAPVDDVLGGLGGAHAAQLAALRDAAQVAYNYVALQSVVVDAIRLAFDIPPAGETAEDVLKQLAAALALVCAAPPPPAELRAQLNAALQAELTNAPAQAASEPDLPAILQDPAAVRLNVLAGRIARPADLVWLNDDVGPVADLRSEIERLERVNDELVTARDQAEARVAELAAINEYLLNDSVRKHYALEQIVQRTRHSDFAADVHRIAQAAIKPLPMSPIDPPAAELDLCPHCRGEKLVADSEGQEPWSMWRTLPVESAAAVILGVVKPITCPTCNGSGRKPEKAG